MSVTLGSAGSLGGARDLLAFFQAVDVEKRKALAFLVAGELGIAGAAASNSLCAGVAVRLEMSGSATNNAVCCSRGRPDSKPTLMLSGRKPPRAEATSAGTPPLAERSRLSTMRSHGVELSGGGWR